MYFCLNDTSPSGIGIFLVFFLCSLQIFFELSNVPSSLPIDLIKKRINVFSDNYVQACEQSHAVIVCTEWDCFKDYDYEEIYKVMQKPALLFDGRLLLDHKKLISIGFNLKAIGKKFETSFLNYNFTDVVVVACS